MDYNKFHKKESPFLNVMGMGGGVPSRLLTLASGTTTYVDDVFSTFLYDGTGSAQTITNGIDLSGEGGMVWTKSRSHARNHSLHDSARGVTCLLKPNAANAEYCDATQMASFNSNGFTVGTDGSSNTNGDNYCSWTFRKCPGFFDVVKFTGNGSNSGVTVSHSLGSVPGSIWVKDLDASTDWTVYHRSGPVDSSPPSGVPAGSLVCGKLNSSDQFSRSPNIINTVTSSSFIFGTNGALNTSGNEYIAYIFAHNDGSFGEDSDEAVIKCGSYDPSQSATTVDLGFEPQWVMIKNADVSSQYSNWMIFDNMRGVVNGGNELALAANTSDNEGGGNLLGSQNYIDFTSTGFIADPGNSQFTSINSDGGGVDNIIYIAIRRPHKPPEAGTDVFAVDTRGSTGDGNEPTYRAPFPVDMQFNRNVNYSGGDTQISARLTQGKQMHTNLTGAESTSNAMMFDYMNGVQTDTGTGSDQYAWMFKRAPGFFDVVTYSGNSTSGRTVPHNLGAVPELMIFKSRNGTRAWRVYASSIGAGGSLRLNSDAAVDSNSAYWSTPTADNIILGTDNDTNSSSYDYLVFLFATLSGISKVGQYTGNGSNQTIDCGFSTPARFLLIKKVSAGNWYLWDSLRGITQGADPHVSLNSTDSQLTGNKNYVYPDNAGFGVQKINGTNNPLINENGENYIFYAIA